MRPFSTISSEAFRNILHEAEPRYRFPARDTLSDKIIPTLYKVERAQLKDELKQTPAVALTTDGWTSQATQSYLATTAHYITNWKLRSKVLWGCHTVPYLLAYACV